MCHGGASHFLSHNSLSLHFLHTIIFLSLFPFKMGDTPTLMFGEKRRGKTFSCSSFTQLVLLLQRLVPGKNTKIQKEKSHVPNTDYYCVFSHHKHPLSTVCVHTANVLYLLCVFTTQVSSSSVSFDLLCVLTLQTSSSSVGFVPVVGSDAHQLHTDTHFSFSAVFCPFPWPSPPGPSWIWCTMRWTALRTTTMPCLCSAYSTPCHTAKV